MAFFVFHGIDKPGMEETRLRVRPAHQARLRANPEPGCTAVAGGPLTDDAGEHMVGSLLVFQADDRAAVERFMAGDPYMIEGIFARTEIIAWRWGLNPPPL
jgi:uncharacterized protein YciI